MFKKIRTRFFSKISNRIFLTSLLLILIVLLIQGFIFRFVIDDAYFFAQENELEVDFTLFVEDLKDKNYDLEYANIITKDYIMETNNPIAIIEEDEILYNDAFLSTSFDSVTLMKDGKIFNFILENPEINVLDYSILNVAAIPLGVDWYYPVFISNEPITENDLLENQEDGEEIVLIENAEVISYNFAEVDSTYSGMFVLLGYDYIENGQYDPAKGKAQSFISLQKELNIQTLIYIDSYVRDGSTFYILTSQSFVSIEEQMQFINSFNIFIFLIGLIVAIFLTRFYSKSISKPMIELNEIATEMADMNFTKKSTIKSTDEIGSLGNSLNELSTKLENSIDDLKVKNEELTRNYELKSIEEKRAKDLILHLSHELNTPLGIVSGFNEILSDGINNKEPDYYYDAMAHELERMKVLITDMLELSVLESSDYTLEMTDIDLGNMISERLIHFKQKFDEKSIDVSVAINSHFVLGNMKKMHQVINNFISNASKYTDEDGSFEITSEEQDNKVIYRFTNTCTTLNEEDLSKLWEKFYRTSKTNTRNEKGSGIGLSIAKEILELHDSHYSISCHENKLCIEFSLNKI